MYAGLNSGLCVCCTYTHDSGKVVNISNAVSMLVPLRSIHVLFGWFYLAYRADNLACTEITGLRMSSRRHMQFPSILMGDTILHPYTVFSRGFTRIAHLKGVDLEEG